MGANYNKADADWKRVWSHGCEIVGERTVRGGEDDKIRKASPKEMAK